MFSLRLASPVSPKVAFNFATLKTLDARIALTRGSDATYFDDAGVLQVASSNTPRFDHSPSTLSSLGLFVERSRTNSIRNNTMQGAVAGPPGTAPSGGWFSWVQTASGITSSIVGVGTEDGINYIDVNFQGTSTVTGTYNTPSFESSANIAASNGQTWTLSSYIKLLSGSLTSATIGFRATSQTAAGLGDSSGFAINANALRTNRFLFTLTINNATVTGISPRLRIALVNGVTYDFTLRIGMPQFELGDTATSVIPTTNAAVTRSADDAVITGTDLTDWFNASKGTFRVDAISRASGNRPLIALDDNSADNSLILLTDGTAPKFIVKNATTEIANVAAGTVTANTAMFAYVSYDSNYFGIARPTARQVDTSDAVPTIDRMRLGVDQAGNYLDGHIQAIQFWD